MFIESAQSQSCHNNLFCDENCSLYHKKVVYVVNKIGVIGCDSNDPYLFYLFIVFFFQSMEVDPAPTSCAEETQAANGENPGSPTSHANVQAANVEIPCQ